MIEWRQWSEFSCLYWLRYNFSIKEISCLFKLQSEFEGATWDFLGHGLEKISGGINHPDSTDMSKLVHDIMIWFDMIIQTCSDLFKTPIFFWFTLWKPYFFYGCHPKKIRLNFTLFFQGGKSTHFFKTKNRVRIKGLNESKYTSFWVRNIVIFRKTLANGNTAVIIVPGWLRGLTILKSESVKFLKRFDPCKFISLVLSYREMEYSYVVKRRAKGHLMSKCPFSVFKGTRKPTKFL